MSDIIKKLQKALFTIIIFLGCYFLLTVFNVSAKDSGFLMPQGLIKGIRTVVSKEIVSAYFPGFSFAMGERAKILKGDICIMEKLATSQFPTVSYIKEIPNCEIDESSFEYYDIIVRKEGTDENSMEDIEAKVQEVVPETPEVSGEINNADKPPENKETVKIPMDKITDFDYLISHFYTVDKTTTINRNEINIEELLNKNMTLTTGNDKPQILIYHTHSQEGYVDSTPGDDNTSIMRVGEELTKILREQYGYNVIHHMGKYDVESRDYAYSNAAPDIQNILAENPSIEVVIDLHRDGVAETTRLVSNVNGKETAKVMFFNGLSKTTSTGTIDYLYNPYIMDNLAMSLQMKLMAETTYPGFTRPIFLKGYRYNMHFKPKCMLVEVGAQTNTLQEALNAMEPLAHILSKVLSS